MQNRKIIWITTTVVLLTGIVYLLWYLLVAIPNRPDPQAEYEAREELQQYQEDLTVENPLVAALSHYEEDFEIHYGLRDREEASVYYLIIVKVDSLPENIESFDLAAYETSLNRAYDWIRARGFNPDRLDIEIEVEALNPS